MVNVRELVTFTLEAYRAINVSHVIVALFIDSCRKPLFPCSIIITWESGVEVKRKEEDENYSFLMKIPCD